MINSLKTGAVGPKEQKADILEKVMGQYAKPEEKQREATKKLGKDEFFKIMVTQMQHQDPLKPYQNEQMAAQMAQFTSLEQMMNVNANLEKLAQAQQPLQQLGASHLIGKHVTVDSSRVQHTEGRQTELKFTLPADAPAVKVVLLNEKGENVREIEAKDLKRGEASVIWDGKKSNSMAATTGSYTLQIQAESENGKRIPVETLKTAMVHGISFEGKETVLLTGDVRSPFKVFLRNVSKIVDRSDAQAPIGGQSEANPQAPESAAPAVVSEESPDRLMEDYVPGQTAKFTPMDAGMLREAARKPEPQRNLSPDEIRALLAERPDLSDANPVAQAMRKGELPQVSPPAAPVAAARPQSAEQNIPRQNLPSGEEGSTAGKWSE